MSTDDMNGEITVTIRYTPDGPKVQTGIKVEGLSPRDLGQLVGAASHTIDLIFNRALARISDVSDDAVKQFIEAAIAMKKGNSNVRDEYEKFEAIERQKP